MCISNTAETFSAVLAAGRNQSLINSSKIAAAADPPTTPYLNEVPRRSCSDGQWKKPCLNLVRWFDFNKWGLFRGLQQLAWHRKSRAVGLCWPACCVVSSDDSCSLSPLACRLSCSVTVLCWIAQFRQSEAEQANLHILYCFNYKDSQPNHSSFTHVLI